MQVNTKYITSTRGYGSDTQALWASFSFRLLSLMTSSVALLPGFVAGAGHSDWRSSERQTRPGHPQLLWGGVCPQESALDPWAGDTADTECASGVVIVNCYGIVLSDTNRGFGAVAVLWGRAVNRCVRCGHLELMCDGVSGPQYLQVTWTWSYRQIFQHAQILSFCAQWSSFVDISTPPVQLKDLRSSYKHYLILFVCFYQYSLCCDLVQKICQHN